MLGPRPPPCHRHCARASLLSGNGVSRELQAAGEVASTLPVTFPAIANQLKALRLGWSGCRQRGHLLIVTYSRTYLGDARPALASGWSSWFSSDIDSAPQDGLWAAHIDLRQQPSGFTRLLFDPQGCRSTHCLEKQRLKEAEPTADDMELSGSTNN